MNQSLQMNPAPESFFLCPVCKSNQTRFVLRVKDHSVSHEFFNIYECAICKLRFTSGAPTAENISSYYQSEDYISHSNTRRGFVNGLYHIVRNRTLAKKFHLLKGVTGQAKGNHLDIGAGTGAFVQYMNQHGWKSVGIEPDEKARVQALAHHQTKLLPASAFESLQHGAYDAISMWHVLEHVHDLYPYLQQIKNLLKPDGYVFIAVPNYTSYDAVKYGVNWAAYDVPRHLYHFSPGAMQWLMKSAGFQLKEKVPMWFDSYYISLLSEKYAGGAASLVKGFFTGALSNFKARADHDKCSSLIYIAGK
jgi:2-polyprenyl-3-methyl-5-hydroxy-6-metoxy-1,4-benzoquinol methylase